MTATTPESTESRSAQIGVAALEKFKQYYTELTPEECWPWTGPTNNGYAIFVYNYKNTPVTKLAWFLEYNEWPKRVFMTCKNRACANVHHMTLHMPNPNMARPNNAGKATPDDTEPLFRRAQTCVCVTGNGIVFKVNSGSSTNASHTLTMLQCRSCGSNWGVVDEDCDVLCMMCGRPFGSVPRRSVYKENYN